MPIARVAVIGAGPCGLAACKALDEFGVPFDGFEARESVGGIWNVEGGAGGGYRSLQTNTSTGGMCFSDFPFSDGHPPYATASQMRSYFEAYAKHFGLLERIRFGVRVDQVVPLSSGGWQLTLADGEVRDYAQVIVATGQYNSPRRPHDSVPGSFEGETLHVFDYLDPTTPVDCRDKSVVVVGLGSSAAELATELSDPDAPTGRARKVLLSARSGRWVMPKLLGKVPADARAPHPSKPPPGPLAWLPPDAAAWLMRRIFGRVLRRAWKQIGATERLGLPEPDIEPWADRPTLSIDFIPALEAGRIDIRPGITRFAGRSVHFSDGTSADADVVLYATGYELDFPFLSRETLGCDAPDLALYQRIAHPTRDGLFFVGCCRVMCSLWPLAEQQARWIARALSGSFALPDANARKRKAVPLRTTLPVMCNAYVGGLRREAGQL